MKPKYITNNCMFESNELFAKLKSKVEIVPNNGKLYLVAELGSEKDLMKLIEMEGFTMVYYFFAEIPALSKPVPVKERTFLRIFDLEGVHDFQYPTFTHLTALGNNCILNFNNRDFFRVAKPLLFVEKQLPAYLFHRIFRGTIIYRGAINTKIIYDGHKVDLLNIDERFDVGRRKNDGYVIWLELPAPLILPLTA